MPPFIENIDLSILRAVDALNIPFLNVIAQALSLMCEHGILPFALAIALMIVRKTRRIGVAMLAALVLNVLITNVTIKPIVARPRPYVKYDISVSAILPHDYSFPSGHSALAFAAAFGFFFAGRRDYPRWSLAGIAVAALIALSRIWLKVHYPSDVLVGAVIGVVCGLVAAAVVGAIFNKFVDKGGRYCG